MVNSEADGISRLLVPGGTGPVFVHSDLLQTASLLSIRTGRAEMLGAHMDLLRLATGGRPLWMPAFNYDFPKTREFDVCNTPSQVGVLPEHFRRRVATWRSPVPVFSFSGEGDGFDIPLDAEIEPFGRQSGFSELVRRDAVILFYGAPFESVTIIHHAEHVATPLYRYDKTFTGKVILPDGIHRDIKLRFHVRPRGKEFDYNWPYLRDELCKDGFLHCGEGPLRTVLVMSARKFVGKLESLMKRDPFSLLDDVTREWAEASVNRLGRRLQIEDFEQD